MNDSMTAQQRNSDDSGMNNYGSTNSLELYKDKTVLVCVTCRLPEGGLAQDDIREIYTKWVKLGNRYRSEDADPSNPGKRESSYFELGDPPSTPRKYMFLHLFAGAPDGLQPADKHKRETESEFRDFLEGYGITEVEEQQHFLYLGGSNFP